MKSLQYQQSLCGYQNEKYSPGCSIYLPVRRDTGIVFYTSKENYSSRYVFWYTPLARTQTVQKYDKNQRSQKRWV